MAVLEKIRVKLGVFISVVIALALLSFIIDPSTLQSVASSMSSKYNVGEINGTSVSYNDFQKEVEKFTKISEIVSGTSAQGEKEQQAVRDAAWQSFVDKLLFLKNAKAAGIAVGDDEMVALTVGDMVSPIIAQDRNFADENGNFSKERLVNLVEMAKEDGTGNIRSYWDYVQNVVYNQQFYTKYGTLFNQSNVINPLMLAKSIEENNVTTSVDFVMVPYGIVEDSTVVVSSNEIKEYYKNHKKLYKQNANRDIEYVVFEVVPSEKDIADANEQVVKVYDEFVSTDNMKAFLLKNSDRQLSDYWYKAGELATVNKEVSDFVDNAAVGEVSPVYSANNTFYTVKVLDQAMMPDQIDVKIVPAQDVTEISDSLKTKLELAEPMQMTQSYLIPGCESLFSQPENVPVLIKTQAYGQLLAEVVGKNNPVVKKQVAILEKVALPSKATYNDFYSKANNLAVKAAGKYENYKAAVAELGLYSTPVNGMLESSDNLGTVENTKPVTRWVFENKAGKASEIITVNNNYFFVAAVKAIHKEGFADIREVAPTIKSVIYNEKLGQKKGEEIAQKINGLTSMDAIAEALGTTVSKKEDVTFASMSAQGLDPKFIGAVCSAEPEKINGPLVGTIGVYVYKVNGRETGSFYSEEDAKSRAAQFAQYNSQMIIPSMMEEAGVKDNRARFY